jgi:hypothetical protein
MVYRGWGMIRIGAALLGLLILSGCTIPLPLRIASWTSDGISVLVSKKSITDHGISTIAERDCAIWRGFSDKKICN